MPYCFYLDWTGWSPEVWAAWAQAILSAVAIVVAARLATTQTRKALRQRIDVYVQIVSDVHDQAEATYDQAMSMGGHSLPRDVKVHWDETYKSLSSVPLHEAPDYRLYRNIRSSIDVARSIRDTYAGRSGGRILLTEDDVNHLHDCFGEMRRIYDDAVKVSNELSTPTLMQRYRHWKFKRRRLKTAEPL